MELKHIDEIANKIKELIDECKKTNHKILIIIDNEITQQLFNIQLDDFHKPFFISQNKEIWYEVMDKDFIVCDRENFCLELVEHSNHGPRETPRKRVCSLVKLTPIRIDL